MPQDNLFVKPTSAGQDPPTLQEAMQARNSLPPGYTVEPNAPSQTLESRLAAVDAPPTLTEAVQAKNASLESRLSSLPDGYVIENAPPSPTTVSRGDPITPAEGESFADTMKRGIEAGKHVKPEDVQVTKGDIGEALGVAAAAPAIGFLGAGATALLGAGAASETEGGSTAEITKDAAGNTVIKSVPNTTSGPSIAQEATQAIKGAVRNSQTVTRMAESAHAVGDWVSKNPIKAAALGEIANEMGIHPFDLMHRAVKYAEQLFEGEE